MITRLQRTVTVSRLGEAKHEAPTVLDHDDCRVIEQGERTNRRLRNFIIVGNAVAWILIIAVVRAIFF